MKNLFLLVVFTCLCTTLAQSQLRAALLAGPVSASVDEKNSIPGWEQMIKPGFKAKGGLNLGLLIELPISKRWYVQPGLFYMARGRKFFLANDTLTAELSDTASAGHTLATNYIDIPLNIAYKLPLGNKNNFFISAGPYLSFFYGGKQKFETRFYSTNSYQQDEAKVETGSDPGKVKSIDIGWNVRAGFELNKILITGFYSNGLTNFYNSSYNGTFHHDVIGASVGFWLNKPKPLVQKPKDTDADGIIDPEDECPSEAGTALTKGCPDRDADGFADKADNCPDVPGIAALQGCPVTDKDQDGINDGDDQCPEVKGMAKYKGCPVPDTDGDGLNDESDFCPDKAGTVEFNGCPIPDSDGDSLNDVEDKCPQDAGPVERLGCPEFAQEIVDSVKDASSNIFFKLNSNRLLSASEVALNKVVSILEANPGWKLRIEGHTDNNGEASYNLMLSQKRAQAVKTYLESKGIAPDRLTAEGFGDTKPLASNATLAGRKQNRRVELILAHY
jgi:OOP family OmpA-OmpF porin